MSNVSTFHESFGTHVPLAPGHAQWKELEIANMNKRQKLYARVPSGEQLDTTVDHVVVQAEPAQIPWFAGATETDVHIADLMYYTNTDQVDRLNQFLRKNGNQYGPFQFMGDVAFKLMRFERKSQKAAEFRGLLDVFAKEEGFEVEAFDQWPHLRTFKDKRDLLSHPLKLRAKDLSHLKGLLQAPNSSIEHCKAAVKALVKAAEKKGLS